MVNIIMSPVMVHILEREPYQPHPAGGQRPLLRLMISDYLSSRAYLSLTGLPITPEALEPCLPNPMARLTGTASSPGPGGTRHGHDTLDVPQVGLRATPRAG